MKNSPATCSGKIVYHYLLFHTKPLMLSCQPSNFPTEKSAITSHMYFFSLHKRHTLLVAQCRTAIALQYHGFTSESLDANFVATVGGNVTTIASCLNCLREGTYLQEEYKFFIHYTLSNNLLSHKMETGTWKSMTGVLTDHYIYK